MRDAIRSAKILRVGTPIDPAYEIARFAAAWREQHGDGHILQFDRVKGHPTLPVLLDLAQRPQILASLKLPADRWLAEADRRFAQPSPAKSVRESAATQELSGFDDLPIMVHQPKDKGRYLTSAVTALVDPQTGSHNLGCYRIYILSNRRCTIFLDPRTDGYAIIEKYKFAGAHRTPATLFLGGPLAALFSGAAAIAPDVDSYDFMRQLSGVSLPLDDGRGGLFPAAPFDCEVVVHGHLTSEKAWEGPFGEFKGYYSEPTLSPVFEITEILRRSDAIFPGLLCGKASGLTLMSMQNELLMYRALRSAGFEIEHVANPLDAYGEYLCLIRAARDKEAILEAAMALDKRAKMFVVGDATHDVLAQISKSPLDIRVETYIRHGKPEGERVGLVVHSKTELNSVHW